MTQPLQLRKAERKKAKLRIGLGGPSGSGKTYSALLMANGMAPWEKIVMIDTENGSGELYSDLGPYNVITITPPFTPEVYIEAIRACERGEMDVVIIDSITHEWDGQGGCLEIVDKLGGKYQDWGKVTPRHKAFIDKILQSTCHIITTVRKKQDYDMVKTSDGKTRVEKLGMKEITREGFEYELTLNFELDIRHNAKAGKDRTGLFMDEPEVVIDQNIGKKLMAWANSGAEPSKADTNAQFKKDIVELCKELVPNFNWKTAKGGDYTTKVKELSGLDLTEQNYEAIVEKLNQVRDERTGATLAEFEAKTDKTESKPAEAIKAPETPKIEAIAPKEKTIEEKEAEAFDALGAPPEDESSAKKLMKQAMDKTKK